MNRTTLGKTGLEVTVLGYGAAEIGYLHTDRHQVEKLLNAVLDQGINLIDVAASYPGSEEAIGQILSNRRGEYVLVSKCGQKIPEVKAPAWTPHVITATVDRSLKLLKTDHLDVMLLHSCDLATLQQGDALSALVNAKEAGKIRWVGYSGDNEAAAWAAAQPEIAVVETSINICDQVNIDQVLPIARQNQVGVLAKRSLANAAWREPAQQPGFYASYASVYHERLKQMRILPEDLGFGGNVAEAWPEIALRFTLSQPGVSSVIIGSTRMENIQRNIEAAAKGPLPAEAVRTVREAFKQAEQASGKSWEGQT
ncbi:MAG TPA: aldo/keto reductase [Tepidisphaeraceae bacterium]|nr:aldo/keto reductase [Tepidisphaeraceae bacterium]